MGGLFFRGVKGVLDANFYISVITLIVVGFVSVTSANSWLEFNEDLYGPMANNLRFMLMYLAVTEIILCLFAFLRKNFKVFIVSGFFLILCIGSLKFYSMINDVEVDENIFVLFLYVGLSHIIYDIFTSLDWMVREQRANGSDYRNEQ